MLWLAALLLGAAQVAAEPPVARASVPSDIAVTVYRDPDRRTGGAIDGDEPNGFALITETRTVRLPAGVATVRFEGVADGIVPVSAIVTGLPGGTVEKNRDARLLSPAALIDGSLGRRVTLRRTDPATGTVREEDATIVAGPGQGVVLRTAAGIETLRCSGLPETPIYPRVPPGLSADPVLSVTTRSPRATTATVTLSYLATDFDWAASYVATVRPDGRALDLFAWMTLANANGQTFPQARVSAVAGRLERRFDRQYREAAARLQLSCYPLGTTTSNLPVDGIAADDMGEIVVTGSRVMRAAHFVSPPPPPAPPPPPEDVGDLKLYRVPERVEVAANQQKQVALLRQAGVPFERVYTARVYGAAIAATPVAIELRMKNDAAGGLGIALPAGSTALYQDRAGGRLVIGQGRLGDTAIGQRVKIAAGVSDQVLVSQETPRDGPSQITLTNANAVPVTVEVGIGSAGNDLVDPSAPVEKVDGVWTWRATVPANGTARFGYRYKR